MKNKNKKKTSMKMGIIVAILLLAVGFAAVSTVLVINGTIKIKPDEEDFNENVVFTEVKATETGNTDANSSPSVVLDEKGKKITFTTQVMKDIGETSVLHYKIKNESQYNAVIQSINCNTTEVTKDGHITITTSDKLKGKTLAKGATSDEEDTVTVTMVKSFVGETEIEEKTVTFECTIQADAQEATE